MREALGPRPVLAVFPFCLFPLLLLLLLLILLDAPVVRFGCWRRPRVVLAGRRRREAEHLVNETLDALPNLGLVDDPRVSPVALLLNGDGPVSSGVVEFLGAIGDDPTRACAYAWFAVTHRGAAHLDLFSAGLAGTKGDWRRDVHCTSPSARERAVAVRLDRRTTDWRSCSRPT